MSGVHMHAALVLISTHFARREINAMGLFSDTPGAFTDGFLGGVGNLLNGSASSNGHTASIERLCQALEWQVDENEGSIVRLHFKDPLAGIRKLRIHRTDGPLTLFAVYCFAQPAVRDVPAEILAYLLKRNGELAVGAWELHFLDDGTVGFAFTYAALAE